MAYVIAEQPIQERDSPASASNNERSFAVSLIKHQTAAVLDVGTGDCACLATILANRGMRVFASDTDHEVLLQARMCLRAQGRKVTYRLLQDDITSSSLSSISFRNIVCFNVLHHVSRFESALAELHRILTADGRLIISDYDENGDGFLKRLRKAVNRNFRSVTEYRRPGGRLVMICEK